MKHLAARALLLVGTLGCVGSCNARRPALSATGDAAPSPRAAQRSAVTAGAPRRAVPTVAWTEHALVPDPDDARRRVRVSVHAPDGFDPSAPFDVVVFFHGAFTCAAEFMHNGAGATCGARSTPVIGAGGAGRHDAAHTNSIFIAPQWTHTAALSLRGRGRFERVLNAVLSAVAAPHVGRAISARDARSIALLAHSAGSHPLREVIASGDLADRVRAVALIDSFFTGVDLFARWLRGGDAGGDRRMLVLNANITRAIRNGRALADHVRRFDRAGVQIEPRGSLAEAMRTHRLVVARRNHDHGWIPLLYVTKAIEGMGLAPRPGTNPLDDHAVPYGQSPPHATTLALGEERRAALQSSDARMLDGALADDYAIELPANTPVRVEGRGGQSDNVWTSRLDVFALVSRDGEVLAADDDGAGGMDSLVRFTTREAGEYRVRVTTHGSGYKSGPYTVRVVRDDGGATTR